MTTETKVVTRKKPKRGTSREYAARVEAMCPEECAEHEALHRICEGEELELHEAEAIYGAASIRRATAYEAWMAAVTRDEAAGVPDGEDSPEEAAADDALADADIYEAMALETLVSTFVRLYGVPAPLAPLELVKVALTVGERP